MIHEQRRRESLSEFLKSRRARISPEEVGLHTGKRRRTPGLRREEVAQLAGVGLTWYTWLEQGREITVSDEILESIAACLKLDSHETHHLFVLAKRYVPLDTPQSETEVIPAYVHRFIEHQGIYPTFVVGRYWDILAWNDSANLIFGGLDTMNPADRNYVWRMFMDPMFQDCLQDWEENAQRMLAEFRASYAHFIDDPIFISWLERLKAHSPEFALWWPNHDVVGQLTAHKVLMHPSVGEMVFDQTTLELNDDLNLRMVVKIPKHNTDTESKLRTLLDTQS